MESSLRYKDIEPWFNKSSFESPVDYDSVLYDRVDDSFYTVVPDLSAGIEEVEDLPAALEGTSERLSESEPPYVLAVEEVDAILRQMFNFDAFNYLESAESEAVKLSEQAEIDFVPARLEAGEPSALMYSGPKSYAFFDFNTDIL